MKAIRVRETGGPEKLLYEDLPVPSPGPGKVLVKIHAIGLNFIDVYYRTGLYKSPLPFTPGMEAAGTVEAVGDKVSGLKPGDRVAYAGALGAYAEYSEVNAAQLVPLPGDIDFQSAAALMLQGMTAHYLTHSTFPLRKGETLLLHAAAGGVGLLLIQIAKKIGARVIGTVSTEEKASLARSAGADHIIFYAREDFELEVKRITGGTGVDVVYDSVGKTTFEKSLNCLRRRGMMVLFGQSSGPVPPLEPGILNSKGSLYLTRPGLPHYTATREELLWRTGDLFQWISDQSLRLRIDRIYPLKEAARAHEALESRETAGKVLIQP
ncbi:MAG TPA: quinone oxidoreductase [Acidobacteriota bacterium]|nr:quinone oxidoreductase [Acidobacteriota bacterium]